MWGNVHWRQYPVTARPASLNLRFPDHEACLKGAFYAAAGSQLTGSRRVSNDLRKQCVSLVLLKFDRCGCAAELPGSRSCPGTWAVNLSMQVELSHQAYTGAPQGKSRGCLILVQFPGLIHNRGMGPQQRLYGSAPATGLDARPRLRSGRSMAEGSIFPTPALLLSAP